MKRIAVFPGSFDPFSVGHEDLVSRGLDVFDHIIVAIGENSTKKYMLSLEKRKALIEKLYEDINSVSVESYSGLTVDFCRLKGAQYILRGIRNAKDFDFEQPIAQMNKTLNAKVETVFLTNQPEFSAINSSIIREIHKNGGDVSAFLPKGFSID